MRPAIELVHIPCGQRYCACEIAGSTVLRKHSEVRVSKISDSKLIKLRIARAYIKLLCLPESEHDSRRVSLARVGNYEVRIFEGPQISSNDAPLFWMELFDHDYQSSVDSRSCPGIEEAVAAFEQFISQ